MPRMEEEIAFLIVTLNMSYQDCYDLPFSRRKRLIEWNQARIDELKKKK